MFRLKPFYRETAERAVSLEDEEGLKKLFGVDDLSTVEFQGASEKFSASKDAAMKELLTEAIAEVAKVRQHMTLAGKSTIIITSNLIPSSSPIFSQETSNESERKQKFSLKRKAPSQLSLEDVITTLGYYLENTGPEFANSLAKLSATGVQKLENQLEEAKKILEQHKRTRTPEGIQRQIIDT